MDAFIDALFQCAEFFGQYFTGFRLLIFIEIPRKRNFGARLYDGFLCAGIFFPEPFGIGNMRQNLTRHIVFDGFVPFDNLGIFRGFVVNDCSFVLSLVAL